MKIYVYSYIVTLVSLMILDTVWLGIVSKNFYRSHVGHLFRDELIWWAVILFYVLYAAAIVFFVIQPSQGDWSKALFYGAIFGFSAYMTYDLVNYATISGWTIPVVIIDILWGACITAIAASVAVYIVK